MKVLGLAPEHDSSVCLIENNNITRFYKEERLSKIKRDKHARMSIAKALDGIDKIDCFVYCAPVVGLFDDYLNAIRTFTQVGSAIDLSEQHHLQHASLAFYNSGFETAAVIVVDRNGSMLPEQSASEAETIFIASYPCDFKEVYKCYALNDIYAYRQLQEKRKELPDCEIVGKSLYAITKVYETATSLIGLNALENGKTMGLATYGNKNNSFTELFEQGTSIPKDYYFSREDLFKNYECIFDDYAHLRISNITKDNYQFYANYAWQVQKQTQEAVCLLIQKALDKTGSKNICITGGYGLNVVSNAYYQKQFPDINFFFEPLADDTGNSIGGAMLGYRHLSKDSTISKLESTFFHGQNYDINVGGEDCTLGHVVEQLIQQKTVAVYYGLAEAGPRALGHRSILFDARNPKAKDIVNNVKKREWYRPFAAMMLKEDADKYFYVDEYKNAEFMTVNFEAKPIAQEEIPGVLHVDNTCRIQIVTDVNEPVYHILKYFKEKTGVGVLLNTSFNLAGMPLVETPEDAVKTLNESVLDMVYFPSENKVLRTLPKRLQTDA